MNLALCHEQRIRLRRPGPSSPRRRRSRRAPVRRSARPSRRRRHRARVEALARGLEGREPERSGDALESTGTISLPGSGRRPCRSIRGRTQSRRAPGKQPWSTTIDLPVGPKKMEVRSRSSRMRLLLRPGGRRASARAERLPADRERAAAAASSSSIERGTPTAAFVGFGVAGVGGLTRLDHRHRLDRDNTTPEKGVRSERHVHLLGKLPSPPRTPSRTSPT